MNQLSIVKLHCRTCGRLNDKPLTVYDESSFSGAEIAVYCSGFWMDGTPDPGGNHPFGRVFDI